MTITPSRKGNMSTESPLCLYCRMTMVRRGVYKTCSVSPSHWVSGLSEVSIGNHVLTQGTPRRTQVILTSAMSSDLDA